MRCPNCKTVKLSGRTYKKISIDICETCKGIWFDNKELNNLVDIAIRGLSVPKDAVISKKICPKCTERFLYEFKYPQTYCNIDMCKNCKGIWLDNKELTEIKIVRESFKKKGQLEKIVKPKGIKGSIIDLINSALDYLKDTSKW